MAAAQILVERVSHYYRPPRGREVRSALDRVGIVAECGASWRPRGERVIR